MDDEQDYEQWIDAMEYYYEHLRETFGRTIIPPTPQGTVRFRYIDEPEQEKLIIIGGE